MIDTQAIEKAKISQKTKTLLVQVNVLLKRLEYPNSEGRADQMRELERFEAFLKTHGYQA